MTHESFIDWIRGDIEPKLQHSFEIRYVDDPLGDFGHLKGIQVDSGDLAGHLYFWSSGFYNFHLFSFTEEKDIVPDTHGQCAGEECGEVFQSWFSALGL